MCRGYMKFEQTENRNRQIYVEFGQKKIYVKLYYQIKEKRTANDYVHILWMGKIPYFNVVNRVLYMGVPI